MIASRVISLITVIQIAMTEAMSSSEPIRMCGGKLSDMIRMTCGDTGVNPAFNYSNDDGEPRVPGRFRRGVVDECCRVGCALSTLELYCISPPKFHKRNSDESGRAANTLPDSPPGKAFNKDYKRETTNDDAMKVSSSGDEKPERKFFSSNYGETRIDDEEPKLVIEDLNKQNNANNIIQSMSSDVGILTQRILDSIPSTSSFSQDRPSSSSSTTSSSSGSSRSSSSGSSRSSSSDSSRSSGSGSSSLYSNAVPSHSYSRESGSSQQHRQSKDLPINNDLSSSMNSRTTHPPLQIGVQRPYFFGKQLYHPKTRQLLESETSGNAQKQNGQ